MAATLYRIQDSEDVWGKHRVIAYDILLDTYNSTDGLVINAGDVGLVRITGAQIVGSNKAAGAIVPCLDFGTLTGSEQSSVALRLFYPSGGGAASPAALANPAVAAGAITVAGTATAAAQIVTMGGSATGTTPGGATPVTSTSASPSTTVPAAGLTATAATSAVPATGLTASGAASTVTPGKGKELANATDVSTLTYRVLFFGY